MSGTTLFSVPCRRFQTLVLVALCTMTTSCLTEPQPSDQDAALEQLESLPYLTWVSAGEDLDKNGVVVHDLEKASPGFNLYSPRNRPQAVLFDLKGEVVHSWRKPIEEGDTWQHVELLPDGELLVVVSERRLLKVDRDSNLLWTLDKPFHHDVAVADDGRIYSILRGEREVVVNGNQIKILDDWLAIVSPDGVLLETHSIFDLFGEYVSNARWARVMKWLQRPKTIETANKRRAAGRTPFPHGSPSDVFHTNSVEIVRQDVDGLAQKGDLLISIRELDEIAIVRLARGEIFWRWGRGVMRRQHQPSMLETGNILVFDNKGAGKDISRVLEIAPQSKEIVWEYLGDPPESFFSAVRSGAQRLPNGNTLITESDKGKVFEVTPAGEIVWEYFVPITNKKKKSRVSVYRMTRLSPSSEELAWLRTGDD